MTAGSRTSWSRGNNSDNLEKTGKLEYLTPDLKEVLFTLTFNHLGIYQLASEETTTGTREHIT